MLSSKRIRLTVLSCIPHWVKKVNTLGFWVPLTSHQYLTAQCSLWAYAQQQFQWWPRVLQPSFTWKDLLLLPSTRFFAPLNSHTTKHHREQYMTSPLQTNPALWTSCENSVPCGHTQTQKDETIHLEMEDERTKYPWEFMALSTAPERRISKKIDISERTTDFRMYLPFCPIKFGQNLVCCRIPIKSGPWLKKWPG